MTITILKGTKLIENGEMKLLTIKQVAQYVRLSVSTLDRMLADGEFLQPDFLISNVKKRLWKFENVQAYLEENCRNPKKAVA